MIPWHPDSELALGILLWSTLLLAAALVALVIATTLLQVRADHRNARRIHAFRRWEEALPPYLFGDAPMPEVFSQVAPEDREFLLPFLGRSRAALGGTEGEKLRAIYHASGLNQGLEARIRHRSPRIRALAALEVGSFGETAHLPNLVPLMEDPVPYVAFAAARTLAQSQDLAYAAPVLDWVVTQERYQQVRLLAVLESFGPGLLGWLEARFRDRAASAGGEWRLFALLAGSHRHHECLPVLLELLRARDVEVQAAAIHALQALGDPVAYASVLPFAQSPEGLLRMQAAAALGPLGGPKAIPELKALLADPIFDVRRHASQSLASLGEPGIEALTAVSRDPFSDLFARDMARERLEWAEQRGRL